jgi:hypothetical protein
MMKLNWGLKAKTEKQTNGQSQKSALKDNFIWIDESPGYDGIPEQSPSQDALSMCRALKHGKLPEYLAWLEQKPKKKIISKFCGIINSKSAGLPILDDEERPAVVLDGISFNPIQNIQGRMMTKITLMLLIETESRKLGIWDELESEWTPKYIQETKKYVQILEAIAKQCQNSGAENKANELQNGINLIKDTNRQYAIQW